MEQPLLSPSRNPPSNMGSVSSSPVVGPFQTTPLRFVILFLFSINSLCNAFQWIQYSSITDRIKFYYDVPTVAVDWMSMVYMVTYIPFIFPATWLLERKGLRFTVLLGSMGTCLGMWIKCLGLSPSLYWVALVGQTISALSQIFILGIPPQLAATWFGENETSFACSIGIFGNQLGVALGFLVPSLVVTGAYHKQLIYQDLLMINFSVAIFTSFVFVAILFVFEDRPRHPPNMAQAFLYTTFTVQPACQAFRNLLTNKEFILLLLSYGFNAGVFYALSTLLNQMILTYYPLMHKETGIIGLLLIIWGMVGTVVYGVILDRTHKYRLLSILLFIKSTVFMALFAAALEWGHVWSLYLIASLLGFVLTGYLPVSFEFGAEITYPESEGSSAGLMNASGQVFGILLTLGCSWMIQDTGRDLYSNVVMVGTLLLGLIMAVFTRENLKRPKSGAEFPNAPLRVL